MARFAYYKNLSAKDRRTYRASDAVTELEVPDAAALRPLVNSPARSSQSSSALRALFFGGAGEFCSLIHVASHMNSLEEALATGARARVARAANAFTAALFDQLEVPRVRIHVRGVRRLTGDAELHGLYTFATEEAPAIIEVWMKTAAHKNVVRFPTFLRTLIHEVVHHVDLTKLGFSETFHTHGFFKRESSLQRQLLPGASRPKRAPRQKPSCRPHSTSSIQGTARLDKPPHVRMRRPMVRAART